MTSKKWYQKTWFLALLCILAPYVGIFFLWKRTNSPFLRGAVSIWAFILIIGMVFSEAGEPFLTEIVDNSEAIVEQSTDKSSPAIVPDIDKVTSVIAAIANNDDQETTDSSDYTSFDSTNQVDQADQIDQADQVDKVEEIVISKNAATGPLEELIVHYIDAGQGDSTLFQGEDFTILIDAGRHDRNDVLPYIQSVGVKEIDLFIGTHPHADHIGQMDKILNEVTVDEVWMSGDTATSKTFERVIDAIADSDASYYEPKRGETFNIGSVEILILSPEESFGDLNEGSLAMKISYGEVDFIFTGDAEKQAESEMVKSDLDLSGQIFQAGHHGSSTSNSKAFLDKVKPEVVIYHPRREDPFLKNAKRFREGMNRYFSRS